MRRGWWRFARIRRDRTCGVITYWRDRVCGAMLASLVSPPGVSLTQKRRQQDAVTMSLSVAPCRCATSTLPCASSLLRRCARSTPPLRYRAPALRHVALIHLREEVRCDVTD